MSDSDVLILAGSSCVCAFFALIVVGGVGYFLMQKKKAKDAEASEPETPEAAEASTPDAPDLTPAVTEEPIPDPSATSSSDETPAEPDPSEILEPDDASSDAASTAEPEAPAAAEPVAETGQVIEEPVPDPSGIAGLDGPIIAADTLDEDEAESPTVIIHRDPKNGEDA